MTKRGLVYVFTSASDGLNELRRKVFEIRKNFYIVKSSSVYQRNLVQSHGQKIEAVIQIEVDPQADFLEIGSILDRIESTLLIVEGELRVDPTLPLPNPIILLDPVILKIAAECAPHWEHRVKQQTLQTLSYQNSVPDHVEFLTQGEALINV